MSSLTVCNRTVRGRSDRLKLNCVNLKGKTVDLKVEIAKKIGLSPSNLELIYCGRCLFDSKALEASGVKSGSTLYALRKQEIPEGPKPEPLTNMAAHQLVKTLQSALLNTSYRPTVDRMLNSPDAMAGLIAATPGLDQDPVAIGMLQDQELLAILAHPSNINKVIEKHPAFAQAALQIAAAVQEQGAKSDGDRVTTGSFYLDQMSDDDDDDRQGPPAGVTGGRQGITSSQLAAALAAAAGASSQGSESSTAESSGSPAISMDFFQQAIQQAQNAANEAQLQQLHDMGITDDNVARQALQVTGGDLQAAIDLIFGDGGF